MKAGSLLTERILDRLELHRQTLRDRQRQLDEKMRGMLELRERHTVAARQAMESVVKPRMEELTRHFGNARVEVFHTDSDSRSVCGFDHIPRFPATVRLDIVLSPGNEENLTARYELSIFPILMDYARSAEETFPLEGNESALAAWVEDRIIDFVDSYLLLETHPLYQKDNMVIDIICGMHIPSTAATSTIERHGRIFYFCSEHCKEAFLRKSDE